MLHALPWALGLSVANAAVGEGICRYGVLAALADRFGDRVAIVASAVLFGGVHWFGTPGQLPNRAPRDHQRPADNARRGECIPDTESGGPIHRSLPAPER